MQLGAANVKFYFSYFLCLGFGTENKGGVRGQIQR
jgi:hypothetical protein